MHLENDTPLLHLNFSEKGNKKFIFANVTDICKTMPFSLERLTNFILNFLCSARTRYPFPFRRNGYYDRKCRVIRQINEMSKPLFPGLVQATYSSLCRSLRYTVPQFGWCRAQEMVYRKMGSPLGALFGNDDWSRTTTEPDNKCVICSVMYNEVDSGDNWFFEGKVGASRLE